MEAVSDIIRKAKARLLKMHFESGVGHIGGNLSSLDLLVYLHHRVLNENDVFVLSKGHSVGALYVTLWSLGKLSDEDLCQFHGEGTKLSGHPAPDWLPEIRCATGSLGHGLPLSAGLALGKNLKSESGRIFCLMSDGEWNEGSNWEAVIFAVQNRLERLTFIVDCNELQGFGTTKEVADLEPLIEKFRSFKLQVEEIDGHSIEEIAKVFSKDVAGPRAVIAHTVKGHGVSSMENKLESHYLPITAEQYEQALEEINGS